MTLKRALELFMAVATEPCICIPSYINVEEYREALRVAEHYIENSYGQIEIETDDYY